MEQNYKQGKILYDIDEGIIKKRVNGKWLELPSHINSRSGNSASINNSIPPSNQNVKYSISEASSQDNKNRLQKLKEEIL